MSAVIARRIKSTPIRTSGETWDLICNLLAPDEESAVRTILNRAAGVACSSIASEAFKNDPAVIYGCGARVRIYALYDDDAVAGEDASEDALAEVPTSGDWRMSIPVLEEDYNWCARDIKACAPHITVRKAGEDVSDESQSKAAKSTRSALRINMEEFFKS